MTTQTESKQLYKAETFGRHWLDMELPFPCELHWCEPQHSDRIGVKRVLVMYTEPLTSMISIDWVLENYRVFDLIFAYDRRLAHLPNAVMTEFGSCWCNNPNLPKDFSISFLLSTGGGTYDTRFVGHEIRREIAYSIKSGNIPIHLFMSSKGLAVTPDQLASTTANARAQNISIQVLRDTKEPLFTSMFHICIENANDDYFFTEKVIDCFRTLTVPIYWGTSKIGEFFDTEGMIIVKDAAEVNHVLQTLTPEDYTKRTPALKANYERAAKYLDPVTSMKHVILERLAI